MNIEEPAERRHSPPGIDVVHVRGAAEIVAEVRQTDPNKATILEKGFDDLKRSPQHLRDNAINHQEHMRIRASLRTCSWKSGMSPSSPFCVRVFCANHKQQISS